MLAGQDLVTGLHDQLVPLIVEPLTAMVSGRRSLLQDCVGGDHLARDQVLANAEVLERALSLSTPQLVDGYLDHAEAICFFPRGSHTSLLESSVVSSVPMFFELYRIVSVRAPPVGCCRPGTRWCRQEITTNLVSPALQVEAGS